MISSCIYYQIRQTDGKTSGESMGSQGVRAKMAYGVVFNTLPANGGSAKSKKEKKNATAKANATRMLSSFLIW